jgi:hypothetical protein
MLVNPSTTRDPSRNWWQSPDRLDLSNARCRMPIGTVMGSDAQLLAQPSRDTVQDQIAPKRKRQSPSRAARSMDPLIGSQDWRAVRIREWLLLLLHFAITWDPKDEAAALAMADEIDALGLRWRPSAPSFFRRTSREVCKAITALDDPKRATILKNHIARIDQPRLRRAFQAAVELKQRAATAASETKQRDLWAGLRG